jgi:hypothetical protein
VNGAREMLLTASLRPADQHGAIGARHRHRLIDHFLRGASGAYEAVATASSGRPVDHQFRFATRYLAVDSDLGHGAHSPPRFACLQSYWESAPFVNEIAGF